jgi:hypothetical protein
MSFFTLKIIFFSFLFLTLKTLKQNKNTEYTQKFLVNVILLCLKKKLKYFKGIENDVYSLSIINFKFQVSSFKFQVL